MQNTYVISGGTGFIGSNIVKYLYETTNAKIIVFDRTLKQHNMINNERILYYKLLLEDDSTYSFLNKYDFNIFFHCGAIVDTLYTDEKSIMKINAFSMHNIINLCKNKNAKLIYSSSASVYGNVNKMNSIDDELKPETLYATSKLEMEKITEQYNNVVCIGLRYFNVYGNGEDHKGNMSSMIYKLNNGHNKLFKYGEQKRDFVYVKDVIQANIKATYLNKSGVYNVGSGEANSFNDIVNELKKSTNIDYIDNPYNFYQNYTCADLDKSIAILNYKPLYNLKTGIEDMLK